MLALGLHSFKDTNMLVSRGGSRGGILGVRTPPPFFSTLVTRTPPFRNPVSAPGIQGWIQDFGKGGGGGVHVTVKYLNAAYSRTNTQRFFLLYEVSVTKNAHTWG